MISTQSLLSMFQQQFNITTTITKAIRIGQHREKPRLLKSTVSTESEKAAILRNCTKLRNSRGPQLFRITSMAPGITWNHCWNQGINRRFLNQESQFLHFFLDI